MLAYCDNRSNLSHPWVNEGFSPCFFTTLSSSLLAAIAILCGGVQIYVYRKYAVRIESVIRRQKPSLERLYKLQLVLLALVCVEPIVRLVLQLTVIRHGQIYWYVNATIAVGTFETVLFVYVFEMFSLSNQFQLDWIKSSF